jgi:hypothetical protein
MSGLTEDAAMDSVIWTIGALGLSLAWIFVPVELLIALFALLNRRDRRQARLLSFVAGQFPGEALRSDIVIEARCAMLAGGAVVRIDIRRDGGEVWLAVERLRRTLPPRVHLVVIGASRPDHAGHRLEDAAASEARALLAVAGAAPARKPA